MLPPLPSRDQFADLLMDRVLAAGETAMLAFDDQNFSIKVEWAGEANEQVDIQSLQFLEPWFNRYQQATDEQQKALIVNQFVDLWFSTKQQALSGKAANTQRLTPLVRSRFSHEATKIQLSIENPEQATEIENQLTYQVFAGHLAVSIAEQFPNSFRQLTRDDLDPLEISFDEALAIAKQNLLELEPNFASGIHFEPVDGQFWCPAGNLHSNNAAALLFPERIKRLPVQGQHVIFVPHDNIIWIADSANIKSLRLVAELNLQEFRECPTPISALPYLVDGQNLEPWLPPISHPAHAAMKMLHIHDASYLSDTQSHLLKQKFAAENTDVHLSVYRPMEIIRDDGEIEYHSICVWTDSVVTLLPKTDFVAVQQLLNRDALDRGKTLRPKFGRTLIVPWATFASVLGNQLRRLETYPERHRTETTLSPQDWLTLSKKEHHFADAFRDELQATKPISNQTTTRSKKTVWVVGGMIGCLSLFVVMLLIAIPAFYLFKASLTPVAPPIAADFDFTPFADPTLEGEFPAIPELEFSADLFQGGIVPDSKLPAFEKLDKSNATLPVLNWALKDLVKSELGGSELQTIYDDYAPAGGWLVGLRLTKGTNWGGAIRAVQPIYQTGDQYQLGLRHGRKGGASHVQIIARPGYAIGKISIRAGLAMNAVQVEFQRVVGSKLDPQDNYQSKWIGCAGGNAYEPLSSDGNPIAGISGSFLDDHFGMRTYVVPNDLD